MQQQQAQHLEPRQPCVSTCQPLRQDAVVQQHRRHQAAEPAGFGKHNTGGHLGGQRHFLAGFQSPQPQRNRLSAQRQVLPARTEFSPPRPVRTIILDRALAAFRVGAATYVGTFLLGGNFNYRLAFLLFALPQLVRWSRPTDRRPAALLALASLYVGLTRVKRYEDWFLMPISAAKVTTWLREAKADATVRAWIKSVED